MVCGSAEHQHGNTVPEDEEIRDKIIPDILSISGNSVDTEYIEMIFQSD